MEEFNEYYENGNVYCPFWKSCHYGGSCSIASTHEVIVAAQKENKKLKEFSEKPHCHITYRESKYRSQNG